MLIFNTYNTLNLKEKIYILVQVWYLIVLIPDLAPLLTLIKIMFGYIIILPIVTNVQKILLHTGGGCLATSQKWPNLHKSSSIKHFYGNQTFNIYLNLHCTMQDLLVS